MLTPNPTGGGDVTVGEVAEAARERPGLPRGGCAVDRDDQELGQSATLAEAGVARGDEPEPSPEVEAA